jgi:diaminopimelate epimerase
VIQPDGACLVLSKHEGAGNDFLVAVDPGGRVQCTAALARHLCDRHRGIGADGLIRIGPGRDGADLSMELRNADGGEAEMSGNGMRCLAQAAVEAGLVDGSHFSVATLAGVRTVTYRPADGAGPARASVDMGAVRLGEEIHGHGEGAGHRARLVDAGNPHLVLFGPEDPGTLAVAEIGAAAQAEYPGGINVEFVAPGGRPDELALRVFERGVGETLACGTGSCAAALAARSWGLVGDRVSVRNPGGTLDVRLGVGDDDPVVLAGPVRRIADITVDLSALADAPAAAVPAGAR